MFALNQSEVNKSHICLNYLPDRERQKGGRKRERARERGKVKRSDLTVGTELWRTTNFNRIASTCAASQIY